jgi:hypothetical protein
MNIIAKIIFPSAERPVSSSDPNYYNVLFCDFRLHQKCGSHVGERAKKCNIRRPIIIFHRFPNNEPRSFRFYDIFFRSHGTVSSMQNSLFHVHQTENLLDLIIAVLHACG